MENLSAVLEALILSSESPLSLEKICAALGGADKMEIRGELDRLISEYDERRSGICIQEVAGGFQFRTLPEMASWIKKLKGVKPASLSPAAMETLAVVAYRQPIVKSEIESIRGVDVSAPLKGLLDKKLVRILGRKDVPGKPMIYGTTKKFLEVFNLKELADLPTMRELRELTGAQELPEQEALSFEEPLPEMPGGEMPQTKEPPSALEEERAETPSEKEPAVDADDQEEPGVLLDPEDGAVS
jgi:segregation and condensation protein B